ncbi:MAG: 2-oxo acid dehydrogenase subunit E2 [Solirubrobacterales bacterium]|nr:2-oxo acid dehydrogenase subunit E2 [Solirubrobacterales bacterium]
MSGARGGARVTEPTRAQRAVARRAAQARATIPDLELGAEVQMDRALEVCEQGSHTVSALLTRACALALRENPRANAGYRDGRFELYSRVNVGLVIADGDEMVVATVFDADAKPLAELTETIAALRHRAGALTQPERSGATFTLTHHELADVAWEVPLVWNGQAAAVAAGGIREAPVVRDRAVVPGRLMTVTLACDHRILYGQAAALFLARIKALLEHVPP